MTTCFIVYKQHLLVNILNKYIIFYKATKSIAKIEVSLLQNFLNKNAIKRLKNYYRNYI